MKKKLIKKLFIWRLKVLLKGYDVAKATEAWLLSPLKEDEKMVKHRKECDQLMLNIPSEYRIEIMKWLQKKIDYLVSENTKDKTEAMQYRIFQSLLEHNQIRALHEADKLRAELAEKENE